ncbi:hypothetical protein H9P43_002123 [Blastocladiella emersonii ATCC 22665]|nr:hypothetical protein H9P43_002123 [Blastocladiella emersonii ATCC 22665]
MFTAFGVAQSLVTSLFPSVGFVAFCVLYSSLAVGSLIGPSVMGLVPVNVIFAACAVVYGVFVLVVNVGSDPVQLILASGAVGFAAGVLWVQQGAFITGLSRAAAGVSVARLTTQFYALFSGNLIVGNAIALGLLGSGVATSTQVLWGMTVVAAVAALLFLVGVRPIPVAAAQTDSKAPIAPALTLGERLKLVAIVLVDRRMLLLAPLIAFSGACITFAFATLPKYLAGGLPRDTSAARIAGSLLVYGVVSVTGAKLWGRYLDVPVAARCRRALIAQIILLAAQANVMTYAYSWSGTSGSVVPAPGSDLADLIPLVAVGLLAGVLDPLHNCITNVMISETFGPRGPAWSAAAFAVYRLHLCAGVVGLSVTSLLAQGSNKYPAWPVVAAFLAILWVLGVGGYAVLSFSAPREGPVPGAVKAEAAESLVPLPPSPTSTVHSDASASLELPPTHAVDVAAEAAEASAPPATDRDLPSDAVVVAVGDTDGPRGPADEIITMSATTASATPATPAPVYVLTEKQVARRATMLGACFLLTFTAFGVAQSLVTSLFPAIGFLAFGMLYACLAVGSLLGPSLTGLVPVNVIFTACAVVYGLFAFVVNVGSDAVHLILASGAVGFAAGVLWVHQGAYITGLSRAAAGISVSRLTTQFYALFSGNLILGNGIALGLLGSHVATSTQVLWGMTVIAAASAVLFLVGIRSIPTAAATPDPATKPSSTTASRAAPAPMTLKARLRLVATVFVDRRMLLLAPLIAFSGASLTFGFATLPKYLAGGLPRDASATRIAGTLLGYGVVSVTGAKAWGRFLDVPAAARARRALATQTVLLGLQYAAMTFAYTRPGGVVPAAGAGLGEFVPLLLVGLLAGALDPLHNCVTNVMLSETFGPRGPAWSAAAFAVYRLHLCAGVVGISVTNILAQGKGAFPAWPVVAGFLGVLWALGAAGYVLVNARGPPVGAVAEKRAVAKA